LRRREPRGPARAFDRVWERWGLRSFFEAHAGLYSANTDYNGRFTPVGLDPSKLGLSQNDVAFIGGIKFETRKQLSPRTSLRLNIGLGSAGLYPAQ
jgi:hypothetical protein